MTENRIIIYSFIAILGVIVISLIGDKYLDIQEQKTIQWEITNGGKY